MKRILCRVHSRTRRRLISGLVNSLLVVNTVYRPPAREDQTQDGPCYSYQNHILLSALLLIILLLLPGPPTFWLLVSVSAWSLYSGTRIVVEWRQVRTWRPSPESGGGVK